MDDTSQSAALAARPRRLTSGRRLLALIAVLALVALLPASALADSGNALWPQQPAATSALNDGEVPLEPVSSADEQTSAEPTPAEPEPAPTEPAPPAEPAPAPIDPAPPAEPAPAPTDPAPPAEPAPSEPAQPVEEWVPPTEPEPRDGRAPAPKPPADEHEISGDESAPTTLVSPLAPLADAPSEPDGDARASEPPPAAADEGAARQAKAVRAAMERLGLGTIAASAAVDAATATVDAAPAPACTPIGTIGVVASSQTTDGFARHATVRPHRSGDAPPAVRGPPVPLDPPSSPNAAAASAAASAGGVSGERDCAILADRIAFTLADGGSAVFTDCCDHAAPAPAHAAARAPPVV